RHEICRGGGTFCKERRGLDQDLNVYSPGIIRENKPDILFSFLGSSRLIPCQAIGPPPAW
ncbi:hypothetical protein, partial [Thalassospira sp.]|uniref:hypothetical protein n=1 Tax=Thalassospira sp. TaxID=1912094 RepID=UPI00257F40E9